MKNTNTEPRTIGGICNYCSVEVKQENGRCYWGLSPERDNEWEEIPHDLYQSLVSYENSRVLRQIADLLDFLIKDAERHGLPEIRISVARAHTILADIKTPTPATPKTPGYFKRLDEIHAL